MVKWRRYINHNKQKQLWDLTFVTTVYEFTGMRRLFKMLIGTPSCFLLIHEHDALLKERHYIVLLPGRLWGPWRPEKFSRG
jgi:hypothetical protein